MRPADQKRVEETLAILHAAPTIHGDVIAIPQRDGWRIAGKNPSVTLGQFYVVAGVDDVPVAYVAYKPDAGLIAAAPDYHEFAYRLAMYVLQSEMYRDDSEAKLLVDDVLAIHAKAEGR